MKKKLSGKALENEAAYWEGLKKTLKSSPGKSCLK